MLKERRAKRERSCLTFAVSKYCILTRVDSPRSHPNVLTIVKTTFGLPISELQLIAATDVSERFVTMLGISRQLSGGS